MPGHEVEDLEDGGLTAGWEAFDQFDTAGTSYGWNADGELSGYQVTGQPAVGFLYDGLGQRVEKTVNGGVVATYIRNALGDLVDEIDGAATTDFVYAPADPLGGTPEARIAAVAAGVFERELKEVAQARDAFQLGSAQRNTLQGVLGFYGKSGDNNGITIAFGALGGNTLAQAVSTGPNTAITFDLSKMKSDFSARQLPPGDTFEAESAGAVAHEVAHAQDAASGVPMHSLAQHSATEMHAYQAQAYVAEGLNAQSAYGFWSPTWAQGEARSLQESAISQYAHRDAREECENQPCWQ